MAKIKVPIGPGPVLKIVEKIHAQVDKRFDRIEAVLKKLVAAERKRKASRQRAR